MEENKVKKKLPLWSKITIWVLGSIVGLFVLVWGGVNILKFAIYADYYGRMERLGSTPGLNDGFIPQGISANEEHDIYIMSGYVPNAPSQIFLTGGNANKDFKTKKFDLYQGDEPFKGHVGGIANENGTVYIACNSRLFLLDLDYLLTTEDTKIDVGEGVKVNVKASFVFTNSEYLYVGEFHQFNSFVSEHKYVTKQGTQYAIVEKYRFEDIDNNTGGKPVSVLSIRDEVQGFAINDSGDIYLSVSYSLKSSIYYKYPPTSITLSDEKFLGDVPVYFLDGEYTTLTGPIMAEDLDWSKGKLICYTESACNKYVIGKFFFADYFFALDF